MDQWWDGDIAFLDVLNEREHIYAIPSPWGVYPQDNRRPTPETTGFYVNCASGDREIELGWSQPNRDGRIFPVECSDFVPGEIWPEPRYLDSWQQKGRLKTKDSRWIPSTTNAGRSFCLRGKGMPHLGDPKTRGDLSSLVKLVLPDLPTDQEVDSISELAEARPLILNSIPNEAMACFPRINLPNGIGMVQSNWKFMSSL